MMRALPKVALAIVVPLVWLATSTALSAFPNSIGVAIYGRPQTDGSTLYDLTVPDATSETVTDPTGHVFQKGSLALPDTSSMFGLTQSQLFAELFGQWTITSGNPFTFPVVTETHTFSISAFSMAEVFTIPPTITSPADGSIVPTQFSVNFAWPAGVTPPNGRHGSCTMDSSISACSFAVAGGKNSFPVTVSLKPGATQGMLSMEVGAIQSLSSHVSRVTTTATNPFYSYSAGLAYYDLSAPVRLTVINAPEPSGVALAALLFSSAALPQRRYFSQRSPG